MTFEQHKIRFIKSLINSKEYEKDFALQRIVEIIKPIHSLKVYEKQKDIIHRIAVDSVENSNSIESILNFPQNQFPDNEIQYT